MSANTAFLNLYKPGGGSSGLIVPDEVVDVDRVNGNMDLIDSFASSWGLASRQTRDFTGPAASLASIVAAAGGARLGDTYQETDSNKLFWKYDGANWNLYMQNTRIGITAASGTGVTLANGEVALAAASGAWNLAIPFSTQFDEYLIEIDVDAASSAADLRLQLRSGGTIAATNYTGATEDVGNGLPRARTDIAAATFFTCGRVDTLGGAAKIALFRMGRTAGVKLFTTESIDSSPQVTHRTGAGLCSNAGLIAAVADGIVLTLSAGSITTGRIRVIGIV